ncbi:MAG: hypothetical protein ACI4BB_00670 [Coprococcus sp.]
MAEVVFDEDWVFMDVIDYEGKEYHVYALMDEDGYMADIKIVRYHNGTNEWGAAVGEGYYSEVEDGVLLAALDEIFRISFGYEA